MESTLRCRTSNVVLTLCRVCQKSFSYHFLNRKVFVIMMLSIHVRHAFTVVLSQFRKKIIVRISELFIFRYIYIKAYLQLLVNPDKWKYGQIFIEINVQVQWYIIERWFCVCTVQRDKRRTNCPGRLLFLILKAMQKRNIVKRNTEYLVIFTFLDI